MSQTVFFLGSHPAISTVEVVAAGERLGWQATWDTSRLPVVLIGEGAFPSPAKIQPLLGGTMMIGTLRATFPAFPQPEDVLEVIPELQEERSGKRLIGVSAFPYTSLASSGGVSAQTTSSEFTVLRKTVNSDTGTYGRISADVRAFSMALKRAVGRKGTRVVFPAARRSDLSTAQLLHNGLPKDGTALVFLVAPERVDLVTVDTIQDIENYARRDRGRPYADPGRGMLPPKVAQMLINMSRVPPDGTLYDPFCGVGTIPMEAALMGLNVIASDISPTQVERTQQNLHWLATAYSERFPPSVSDESAIIHDSTGAHAGVPYRGKAQVFVHDMTKGAPSLKANIVHAVVTEGWLGPARSASPLPHEAEKVFSDVSELLHSTFERVRPVVRSGGSFVVTVPAFRVKKRLFRFPLEQLSSPGWKQESLVPSAWRDHTIFRDAAQGTLLYGRPDAIVLREVVRFVRA
ncbi:MAG: hypothetical protein G01um1014106_392 [Parcubacteria group bacterium Gr01-1014_106]|nr:MAG: hypothetical protein G01um1014106_392 [Parcubacteria group bacterium Gr01-1014_106]